MTSLTTATDSFHLPQHTQLLPYDGLRRLELESAYSCAPPAPQTKSYFNPETNETSYIETEVKVNEIGVLYYYEIRHDSDVTWSSEEGDGEDEGFFEKAGNFFGDLFGGDDEEEAETSEEAATTKENVGNALEALEQALVAEIWDTVLDDWKMTWTDDGSGEMECTGMVVLDPKVNDEYEDDGDLEDLDEEMKETKLLGLTHQPLDAVNPGGCTVPDDGCTSIAGQVSIAYSGFNEFAAIQTVISQIQNAMEAGDFIPADSPAESVEFQRAGGTAPPGSGAVITLNTDRGTEEPEESYLSKYGVLFVCLVAILGMGFLGAMYFRYKKRQSAKEVPEGGEQEEAMDTAAAGSSEPSHEPDSPVEPDLKVDMPLQRTDSYAEDADVEISLSPAAKVY